MISTLLFFMLEISQVKLTAFDLERTRRNDRSIGFACENITNEGIKLRPYDTF